MIVRFILKRKTYSGCNNDTCESLETLDASCPELEKILQRGGFGGGPNGDDYDRTVLVGAELKSTGD